MEVLLVGAALAIVSYALGWRQGRAAHRRLIARMMAVDVLAWGAAAKRERPL